MANTVRLTWAVPVSAHLLEARLEAYVESKATITTFLLCAQNGKVSCAPVARLPTELIDKVVGYLSHSFFEEQLRSWKDITRCMEGRCTFGHDHNHEDHEHNIYLHLSKIRNGISDTVEEKMFAKCRQVHYLRSIRDTLHADDNARYLPKTSASRFTSTLSAYMMKRRTNSLIHSQRA